MEGKGKDHDGRERGEAIAARPEFAMVAMLLGLVPLSGLAYFAITLRPVPAGILSIMVGFVPLTAASYYLWRRRVRKRAKIDELECLGEDWARCQFVHGHDYRPWHFFLAVAFTTTVTYVGMATLFHALEPGTAAHPIPLLAPWSASVEAPELAAYQGRAIVFFGVAFTGAYLWGLNNLLSRYFANDLLPGVYYGLGVRMIFSALLAVLVYHALPDVEEGPARGLLPALAFLIGMFPQRALKFLTDKLNLATEPPQSAARELPLEVVQGISVADRLRLAENGVSSAFDLATADFLALLARTPYEAEKLIDWILQAKLALVFPHALGPLRENGIRTILDLEHLGEDEVEALVANTPLTRTGFQVARRRLSEDGTVGRLRDYRERLRGASR